MTVNKITKAPTQNEIINTVNDLIDNKQDTLIAGTDLEIVNATTPKLPAGYTELEWLQSDGDSYINTGIYANTSTSTFHCGLTPFLIYGTFGVFGSRTRQTAADQSCNVFIVSGGLRLDWTYGAAAAPVPITANTYYDIECSRPTCTINGVQYTSATTVSSSQTYPFYIGNFANAENAPYATGFVGYIHFGKLYTGNSLVFNGIPCRRKSDNVLGMYDTITNTFFANSGAGTFTGGPEVIYPTTTTINFTNASGYTSNVGTVTSVNNTQPDANGNVTIQTGGATDVQINSTSITSGGVANIVTNSAYNASSNKIATMSDLPADKIFIATYGTTTFNEVWTAYDAGKTVFVKDTTTVSGEVIAVLNYFEFNSALDAHFEFASSILNDYDYYTYSLDQDSIWSEYTEQIPDTSGFANTDLSNLTATGEAHFQEPLVSGTNIKTINSVSLLSSGNLALQTQLISGTNIKTINNTSVLGNGNISVQEPLVSGTNIKTINSTSLLGSGNISVLTSSSTEVASSRFDGQWIAKKSILTTSTAINTYTLDLVNYLPSGGDKYEVLVACNIVSKNTSPSNTRLYSDIISISTNYLNQKTPNPSHWLQNGCLLILPVTRYLYFVIDNQATGAGTIIEAVGYRRIGTNT